MLLSEMTMSGRTTLTDTNTKPYFEFISKHGKYIGDQGGLRVLKTQHGNSIYYGMEYKNQLVSFLAFSTTQDPNIWELKMGHTLTAFRRQHHILNLMWFVKDQEQKSFLDYGIQSNDVIALTRSLASTNRFSIVWFNTKTKKKQPYDPSTDNVNNAPFRSNTQRTEWRIMIERNDYTPTFTRYAREDGMIVSLQECHQLFTEEDTIDVV